MAWRRRPLGEPGLRLYESDRGLVRVNDWRGPYALVTGAPVAWSNPARACGRDSAGGNGVGHLLGCEVRHGSRCARKQMAQPCSWLPG
jgi:hypothetical protein